MKKVTFILCIAFSCLCLMPMAFAQLSPAQQLATLLNRYTTFEASFQQTTYDENGQKLQSSEGQVWLARPGKFRWSAQKPNRQIVVANGEQLWIYDVDLAQVTVRKVNANNDTNPAALLSQNAKKVLTRFRVSIQPNSRGEQWFQLVPKRSPSGFKMVWLYFNKGYLTEMRLKNNLGQTSVFRFGEIKLNRRITSSTFQFRAPKGVDVLRQ